MSRWLWRSLGLLVGLLALAQPAPACNLCNPSLQQGLSLREEAEQARLILYGTLENPQIVGTSGTTDLRIEGVLKSDKFLARDQKKVTLQRYVPVDPKDPPRFVVFCDIFNDKLDPYRGMPLKSAASVDYLKGLLTLDARDRSAVLLYCFRYLEDDDKEVAADAFLEFARANDKEIGQIAGRLSAAKLRTWVQSDQTPSYRLGLYAFMLGSCGGDQEATLLRSMLENPTEETMSALDGILGGYIRLRPREGWNLALTLLRDEKKPFPVRYAVLRTLRFYHGWQPQESKPTVLQGLAEAVPQGDLADLAVEDLRKWQVWDLTPQVLACYGKKTHNSQIVQRSILRYALNCPREEARNFIVAQRGKDPELVKDVEESLRYEKLK